MSKLSIEQILSSRFRTSSIADQFTKQLMEDLGLSTKASVARLAIGRSLALGSFSDEGLDSKGLDIPASSLFRQEDIAVWIGMIVTHAITYEKIIIDNMESFRSAVRQHWHRGATLLIEDWNASGEDYDKFIETLINRRAELPGTASSGTFIVDKTRNIVEPKDASAELSKALKDIGVNAEVKGLEHGPRMTRYKVFLPDVNLLDKLRGGLERLSLVLGLQQAMPTLSHGDQAKTVFLDIPRPQNTWQSIGISELLDWTITLVPELDKLMVYPGVDVMGKPFFFDLATAPHLFVGGATGQGKSVCLHALILSLIIHHTPDSLLLALIDPKQVEFSVYQRMKFVYGDGVAVDIEVARECLIALIDEMNERFTTFNTIGVTNISEARRKGIKLPFIVAFIEELADLVLQDKDMERLIVLLAQKARAAGIHLVLATQRPDAKTFSGLIRSNIPVRIALYVQKSTESSIILDETGAENLMGAGDMLVKIPGKQVTRVHGIYISRQDIENFLKKERLK